MRAIILLLGPVASVSARALSLDRLSSKDVAGKVFGALR